MRAFILTVVIWLLALPTFASESESVDTGKVVASIVSSHDSVAPGQEFYIALRTVLDEGWHTYWRNPGDSGEPVQINWELPEGVTAGEIYWPLPRPIPTGPIVNYGFEGTPLFPVKFTVSPDAEIGTDIAVVSNFYYLVCEEICIPEYGSASLSVAVGDPIIDARWSPEIEAALAVSPIRGEVQGAIQKSGGIVDISDIRRVDWRAYSQPHALRVPGYIYQGAVHRENSAWRTQRHSPRSVALYGGCDGDFPLAHGCFARFESGRGGDWLGLPIAIAESGCSFGGPTFRDWTEPLGCF